MPTIATEWTECLKYVHFFAETFGRFEQITYLCIRFQGRPINCNAEIAQLVEHNLAKVGVASSSLVFRSCFEKQVAQVAEW